MTMIPRPATAAIGRRILSNGFSQGRKNLTTAANPAIPMRTGMKVGNCFAITIITRLAICRKLQRTSNTLNFMTHLLFQFCCHTILMDVIV